jgi:hypothetical protein
MQVTDDEGKVWTVNISPYWNQGMRMWSCSSSAGSTELNDAAIRSMFGRNALSMLVLESQLSL